MMRRFLVHSLALLVGVLLGMGVASFVHERFDLDPIVQAVVVAAFIFLLQIAGYHVATRLSRVKPLLVDPPTRGSGMWGWLKPASGFGTGFPLTREKIQIGRGVDMDITLNNASISRRHAEVSRLMEGCLLRDIGSRNGVFVNGERIQEQLVTDGDLVGLGDLRFVFHQVSGRSAPDVFTAPPLDQGMARSDSLVGSRSREFSSSPTITRRSGEQHQTHDADAEDDED